MPKQQINEVLMPEDGKGLRIAIVTARFNRMYTAKLERAGILALHESGVKKKDIRLVHVPGSLELPFVAARLQKRADAIICFGVVLRGETSHFDIVMHGVERGITTLNTKGTTPVLNGVVFADTEQQVMDRTKDDKTNVGYYTALAAVNMALTSNKL